MYGNIIIKRYLKIIILKSPWIRHILFLTVRIIRRIGKEADEIIRRINEASRNEASSSEGRWDIKSATYLFNNQCWDNVLPILNVAEKISAKSFLRDVKKVNVSRNAIGNYKIISLNKYTEPLKKLYFRKDMSGSKEEKGIIDNLVADILTNHIDLDGRELTVDDCLYYSMLIGRGAPFTHIHNDTDWMQFPDADGFQFWFLLENVEETGNMFLVNTPLQGYNDPPESLEFMHDGTIHRMHLTAGAGKYPKNIYQNIDDCKFTFKYLDMKPGECLVFSKRQLHMSDCRPILEKKYSNRLAISMRIIIKKPGCNSIKFWPYHPYTKRYRLHKHLAKICDKNLNLNVRRFSMVDCNCFNDDSL